MKAPIFKYKKDVAIVNFYGSDIPLVWIDQLGMPGVVFVDLVESMGLDYRSQSAKVKEDPFYMMGEVVVRGRPTLVLPIIKLNAYLFRINPNKIDPNRVIVKNGQEVNLRAMILKYQEECAIVLSDYWNHGMAVNARDIPYGGDQTDVMGPVAQSRPRLGRVIANYCDYAERQHGHPIDVDVVMEALHNIFGDYIDVSLVKDPTLAAQGLGSGRDLMLLSVMEQAAADALKKLQYENLHPRDTLQGVSEYVAQTLVNLGNKFMEPKPTWNRGNGLF